MVQYLKFIMKKAAGSFGKDKEPIGLRYSTVNGSDKWESFVIGLEKYEQVANLRNQGLNQQAIAEELGLSQGEVSKRLGTAAKKGSFEYFMIIPVFQTNR